MNIVNRRYKYLFVVFISIAFLTGCASKLYSETNAVSGSATSEQVYSKEDAYRLLTNAKEIKLYKQVFSLHDYWEIYADGVQVAKVEGILQ